MNRYKEYKDSGIPGIEKIPTTWKTEKLKHLGTIRLGLTYSPQDVTDETGTLVLRSGNIQEGKISLDDNVYVKIKIKENLLVKAGDILICARNGSQKLIGKSAIIPDGIDATFGAFMCVFSSGHDNRFYYYILNSLIFYQHLGSLTSSTVNQLTVRSLGEILTPLPTLDERATIADFLDAKIAEIDGVVEKLRRQRELLERYKRELIWRTLTSGLDAEAEVTDSGINWVGEYPTSWKSVRVRNLFEIIKRIEPGLPSQVLSITQRGIVPKDLSSNFGQLAESYDGYQRVDVGDFAMNAMDLLTGWVDQSEYDGVTSPDYRVFRFKSGISANAKYYTYVLQMGYKRRIFYKYGQGVSNLGRWRLQPHVFRDMRLPYPPVDDQAAIVEFLDVKTSEIDGLLAGIDRQVELLQKYRKQLINDVVTGKVRVCEEDE